MLHQLPTEVLQIITQLVHNNDLCTLSTLCHVLHAVSLSTLFSRAKTFEPLSTRSLCPASKRGPPTKLFHQSHGLCITLESVENLNVLRGLRLALPYMYNELQVNAVVCTFNGPLHNWAEIKSLERFLSGNRIAPSIESVVVDFIHSFGETGAEILDDWDPMSDGAIAINRFLRLFSGANSKKVFPRCVSVTIFHDTSSNYWDDMGWWGGTKPSWLRRGSRAANLMQSLVSISSPRFRSIFRSNPQVITINPSGLRTLNIQSGFIFHPLFINSTSSMLAQSSDSLHSLSLDCIVVPYWEWSSVLGCISLPRLKELYLGRSCVKSGPLLNFLLRHRSIECLDLGSCNPIARRGRPPGLLPKLKTLKATEGVILQFFPLPAAPSKLQFITIIFLTDHIGWFFFWTYLRALYETNPGFTYTLQIRVEARCPTEWLRLARDRLEALEPNVSIVRTITSIEIYTWEVPKLLELKEIRSDLVSWLEIFPEVVAVDMVGCSPMDGASWKELVDLVKERVPRIESFRIDGRDLSLSTSLG
ncbi:hypothetical protein AX16_001075 [Volvariella volvacea WC 439]|nr:hypothetical protein AX16_001075 [Volvariella volvacea WC 439]